MHAPTVRPTPGTRQAEPLCAAALALLCAAILAWRWVGFQGHDDSYYATAALDWLHHPPALGDNHWALRYPLVIPMAAALAVFGKSLWVLAVPTLVAYLAWLGFTYAAMRAALGWQAAALATLAAILIPEFPVQATYANPDILELVFLLGSFWCFQSALRRPDRTLDLVHCGTLAGLAFLTRETAAAIVPFYALLFATRPGMPRRAYLPIAAAFATIVALEFLYFWLRAGDPLYRLHLSATHDTVNRAAQATAAAAAGHALDTEGVLAGPPLFQIVSVLFISQKYGPLFLLAIPATFYARGATWLAPRERRVITDAALLALCLAAFVALAAGKLYIVPRYFTAAAG
ncbi:MAG TPA: glycosyltransferase family 39 protein, partial [Acetobacteraceae bacterium]|nr:glycosyltransferase family 39 protein [Acetobacteraceae bacterium]